MVGAEGNGGFVSQGATQRSVECSVERPEGAFDQTRLGPEGRKLADGNEARISCRETDSIRAKHGLSKCHSDLNVLSGNGGSIYPHSPCGKA